MNFEKNDIVTVVIEDMGNEGEGIGKAEGFTLFVKDAVAGDVVEARILKPKKNYAYAKVERILKPSPFRVEPPCRYHRQCGGCQLQALSYEKQLEFKQEKIRNSLIRIGGFDREWVDRCMEPIVGMEEPFRYRNKAQYPVGTNRAGKLVTGFYAGRTHDIIANRDCLLGGEENEKVLDCVLEYMEKNQISAYDEKTGKGLVRHILIRKGFSSGEIMVCLVINQNMTKVSCDRSGKEDAEKKGSAAGAWGRKDENQGGMSEAGEGKAEGRGSIAEAWGRKDENQGGMSEAGEGKAENKGNMAEASEKKAGNGGNENAHARITYLPRQKELIDSLKKIKGMTSVSVSINTEQTNVIMGKEIHTIWGSDTISDTIRVRDMRKPDFPFTGKELTFQISPLSFYQVNPTQTEKLYSLALEYAGLTGEETVWDLYCGIGTISLFLAGGARQVYGVEIVPEAIRDARDNARCNGIQNAEFFVGGAEDVLQMLGGKDREGTEDISAPDVVVVDPPRKGCDASCLDAILAMQPERIVYVSCDPATLARDLRTLCDGGYEIRRVRGVDQFGMTVHVECVVLMSRVEK